MASNLHSANGIPKTETESGIPATAVEVATEMKVNPLADRPTVTPVDCVFRVIVPMLKVESIIGRNGNGDLINKICQETKAHMRVLEDPVWHPDRVVQISSKEETEAPLSPAKDAVIRVFKRVNGFPENESNGVASTPFCSIRLLVSSMQATGLIGKQGSSVHTIQENIGCSVRILSSDEVSTLSANSDDRVVDLHGAGLKVLQALEAVLGHLRALPLAEKTAKTVPNGAFSEPVKRPTFHPSDKTTPSSPLFEFGFGFASSSSSTPFSVSSPTFGFGASAFSGSSLFGSSSSSSGTSLFGSTFTFGTSTIFGASSTSAVTSPFSSGLYGSSSPTPSFTTPTTTNTANKTFGTGTISGASSTSAVTSPFSSGLYGSSSSPTPSFTTPTTTNTGHFKKRKKTTTNTFGTSTIFGASSTSAVTSPFSSGLYGSSSSPTPDFTTPTTTNTASKTFGTSNIFGASSTSAVTSPFSSGFFGSSSPAPSFMTPTTTNTASKPFGTSTIYGASSTSAVTKPFSSGLSGATTGYVPSFASATTTSGTSSSFLGFQTSPKTVAATTQSLQPQSTPASSLLGAQNIKDSIRNKAYWNVDIIKTFLDACIHEITINGWDGGNLTLKAMSWKKVGEKLKKRHNFSVDIEQMEDYFDGLKSKYIAWLSLRNECIKTLKNPPLPFPDLCAQLFYGALAAGFFLNGSDRAFTGPAHRKKRHREVSGGPSGEASFQPQAPPVLPTAPPLPTTQTLVELQKEPVVEVPPELPQVQPATAFIEIETEAEVPPELPQLQPATIIKTKRSRPVFEEEILGVLKMIAGKMNKPEPPPKPTFEDCEQKLNELGWPKDDPLHLVALTIFCDEKNNYRELWMKLNKNLCANWVRMIGRGERFL